MIDVRGQPTVAPRVGYDEQDFMDMIRRADYSKLGVGFKPGDIINRSDAKFEYYQEGRYKVKIGNVVVQDINGRDFVVDLNENALAPRAFGSSGPQPMYQGPTPATRSAELEAARNLKLGIR
jgi:hypothetical protein